MAANVLNESTFSSSILNTINPSNAVAKDLSRVLLIIVDEIHTAAIDAAKGMQEAFVHVDFGGEGNDKYSLTDDQQCLLKMYASLIPQQRVESGVLSSSSEQT